MTVRSLPDSYRGLTELDPNPKPDKAHSPGHQVGDGGVDDDGGHLDPDPKHTEGHSPGNQVGEGGKEDDGGHLEGGGRGT